MTLAWMFPEHLWCFMLSETLICGFCFPSAFVPAAWRLPLGFRELCFRLAQQPYRDACAMRSMVKQDFEVGMHRSLLYSEFLILKASEFSLEEAIFIKMRTTIADSFSRKGQPNRLEIKMAYT